MDCMVSYSCVFHERPLKATLIGISEHLRDKRAEAGEWREMVLETAAWYESREAAGKARTYRCYIYSSLPEVSFTQRNVGNLHNG